MIEQTGYALDLLRENADFTLYRGRHITQEDHARRVSNCAGEISDSTEGA